MHKYPRHFGLQSRYQGREIWPKFDQILTIFWPICLNFNQIWPNLTKFWPQFANFNQSIILSKKCIKKMMIFWKNTIPWISEKKIRRDFGKIVGMWECEIKFGKIQSAKYNLWERKVQKSISNSQIKYCFACYLHFILSEKIPFWAHNSMLVYQFPLNLPIKYWLIFKAFILRYQWIVLFSMGI